MLKVMASFSQYLKVRERIFVYMKNYVVKNKKNANEIKVLKGFFGVLLFMLAVFFRDMIVTVPQYIGVPLAVTYLFIQYKLWNFESEKR